MHKPLVGLRQSCSNLITVQSRHKFWRWQDVEKVKKQEKADNLLQKKWTSSELYITPEKPEDVLAQKSYADKTVQDFGHPGYDKINRLPGLRHLDYTSIRLRAHRRKRILHNLQHDQRFIPERHIILGAELAAAHFIVHRGGSVKFFGDDTWHSRDPRTLRYTLPSKKISDLYIEAIDASTTPIVWEGFDNLIKLQKVRFLNLSKCYFINDWCIDKLGIFSKSLEFLDLSHCKRVSPRGLTGLSCLKKLRILRIAGLETSAELGHAVSMLEESIPGLSIIGVDYPKVLLQVEQERKLLEHPNVVQDARGNLFAVDSDGEHFFLKGPGLAHERPVVDEFGVPLLKNLMRKDPPNLPYEVVEELNALSGGKLKHALIGSPSGDAKIETERILAFEAYRLFKERKRLPEPALVPECMKGQKVTLSLGERVRLLLPHGAEFEANLPPRTLVEVRRRKEVEEKLKLLPEHEVETKRALLLESKKDVREEASSEMEEKLIRELIAMMKGEDRMEEASKEDVEEAALALQRPPQVVDWEKIVKSLPPKPSRPPRLFSKFVRYTSEV